MESVFKRIAKIAGQRNVLRDEPMSAHTTFRVGGPADYLVMPETLEALTQVLILCREEGIAVHVMGRGSNLLVADTGIRGCVVQLASNFSDVDIDAQGVVAVQAGATNARVAAMACRAGFAGYEFAAGIPGTVGGAAIMNAGAYDGEFKHVAQLVTCLNESYEPITVQAAAADWSYRHSMMADAGYIVVEAILQLHEDDPNAIQARMDDLARRRTEKQPLDVPSAGSTFKRPPGQYAGKLIQDAGMQGYRVGGAQVSTKHAGFVVNTGDATAEDVRAVIRDVQERVQSEFGVLLEPEVRMWGF